MIRIPLLGRTGNNLFQYAMGRALAEKHGVPLLLDASYYDAAGWAQVSHFLKLQIAAKIRRHPSLISRAVRKLTGRHYWEYSRLPVLRENPVDHTFDASLSDTPADSVLIGYFQSPLYFASIAEKLRDELTNAFSKVISPDPEFAKKLSHPSSVAVHVRRTDFLVQPVFQVCGGDYYANAIARLRGCLPDARFFIFSDDPEWCRGEFTASDQTVVDAGSAALNPLHDLHLMSLASHHIIANSSYSWWAAWLGKKPGQEVLIPDRWFASDIHAPIAEKKLEHWTIVRSDHF